MTHHPSSLHPWRKRLPPKQPQVETKQPEPPRMLPPQAQGLLATDLVRTWTRARLEGRISDANGHMARLEGLARRPALGLKFRVRPRA